MIIFDSVTKRFPDGTTAVDHLDLEIPTGKITVLVGPSGCGKTTTLRMINRMVEPTSGRVLLDGEDVRTVDPPTLRRRIGYVIQQAGLFPHRTILDNIATVPYLLGWNKKKARARAMELLERVGLPASFAKRYPFQLSGGQQQRVGVARALAADPPVMLMDEPFSAVDPVVRKSLQEEFLRLQAELHKTIVFVTHDIDEAIKLGDMIAVMRVGGKLAQYDPPEVLLARPADAFVQDFLGADRGIRRLSFLSASALPLHEAPVVPQGTALRDAPAIAERAGDPWLLVVDAERRPLGWYSVKDGVTGDGALGEAALAPYGRTFRPGQDSLRVALDSAVLSPSGHAVAVDDDGRVVGVASQADITEVIQALDSESGRAGRQP
ncbi:proline/glycine betaine ABC transporter ATP-binding protein [Carbonactinospora thermoautotrophica]|uniref:ABC transporter ATP-binding protein n=1 Tax=Carbonactinospora thermoautotrophica TaxID=1469144 RepID=UPI0022709201|nr:ABC transporter ATP-binding protein [Carbonactinospora thermoautotrophica]MCX9190628.1 proline/glycine betaine ABC transporter ATP-binding protein [Carbonactinospora thermoautotrophica]